MRRTRRAAARGPAFRNEYVVRTPVFIVLCIVAAITSNRWFHIAFVGFTLIYQTSWILRLFDTIA